MRIDENTQVMARFHPEANNRGLNIYNPYFERAAVNAIYVLFHNPDPEVLIRGMRDLGIHAAIVAGSFEKDPQIARLIDEVHPLSKRLGRVGCLANRNGRIWGVYQGAFGLYEAVKRLTEYVDKK